MSQSLLSPQTVLCFDLSIYGHHATYLQYLIRYWQQQHLPHPLKILVSPEFLSVHQDVVILAEQSGEIDVIAITTAEATSLQPRHNSLTRNLRNWQEWRLYCQYARQLQATQSLIMYFDTYQLLLALGGTSPCPFSGIYFRPTFHYGEFGDPPQNTKTKLQRQWEYQSLKRVLQNPQLRQLLSLDPFAVDYLKSQHAQAKITALADPIEIQFQATLDPEQLKQQLGIDAHRQVGILFGALTRRKGIYPLLKALAALSPEQAEQFCLLLVGAADATEQQNIQAQVAALRQVRPVQIIEHYEFVAEASIPSYFQASDWVLAPYQQHVGMSGILLWAAAAQKPVLCSDYGLMGQLVTSYQLGITVDARDPSALAQGLGHLLASPADDICDRTQMARFAQQNTWETFAQTIVHQLGLG